MCCSLIGFLLPTNALLIVIGVNLLLSVLMPSLLLYSMLVFCPCYQVLPYYLLSVFMFSLWTLVPIF